DISKDHERVNQEKIIRETLVSTFGEIQPRAKAAQEEEWHEEYRLQLAKQLTQIVMEPGMSPTDEWVQDVADKITEAEDKLFHPNVVYLITHFPLPFAQMSDDLKQKSVELIFK